MARFDLDAKNLPADAASAAVSGLIAIPDAIASAILAGVSPTYAFNALMTGVPVGSLLTGTQFMNIVHDLSPTTRDVGPAPPWIVERPSTARMLAQAYVDAWRKPGQVIEMLKEAGPTFMRLRRGRQEKHLPELNKPDLIYAPENPC